MIILIFILEFPKYFNYIKFIFYSIDEFSQRIFWNLGVWGAGCGAQLRCDASEKREPLEEQMRMELVAL